jgi:septin family protein
MESFVNPELNLAFDFVQGTQMHIFLTGKAGTGKTTFLRNLRELSPKRMVVVAPTGVAAINAGELRFTLSFSCPFTLMFRICTQVKTLRKFSRIKSAVKRSKL